MIATKLTFNRADADKRDPFVGPSNLARLLSGFCWLLLASVSPSALAQVYPGGPLTPLSEIAREQKPPTGGAPDALFSPDYCDSDSLRSVATIRAIRFGDDRHGVAVGDHGAIWITHDGGRTWNAPSQVTHKSGKRVECQLTDAAWMSPRRVIAVGGGLDAVTGISRGMVLISIDAGETWKQFSNNELPCLRSLIQPTDWRATSSRNIIACGDVDLVNHAMYFESNDGGVHWQSLTKEAFEHEAAVPPHSHPVTAQSASQWAKVTSKPFAVRTSCRLKDQTIFCAGDHGLILRSEDQGRAWQTVHGGQATCAVLVIANAPETVPWSLIGREALEHRLRVHTVIASREVSTSRFAVEQAGMYLGAVATDWCLDPENQTPPTLTPTSPIESICRWIDTHRPKVIAIDDAFPSNVKTELMQYAVSQGAQRVIEYSRTQRGESLLHRSAMLPGSGVLAGDFDADSALLAGEAEISIDDHSQTDGVFVQSKFHGGAGSARGVMMADGVMIPSSGRLPARSSKVSRRRLQVVQGRLKQDSTIDELIRVHGQSNPDKLVASLDALLNQTSRVDQFRVAWSVVTRIGSHEQADAIWRAVAKRFPDSSAARLVLLHADARRSSVEWSTHLASNDGSPPAIANIGSETESGDFDGDPFPAGGEIQQASQLVPSGHGHQALVSPFQTASDFSSDAGPSSSSGIVQASALLPSSPNDKFRPMQAYPGMPTLNRLNQPSLANEMSQPAENQTDGELDLAWEMHPVRLIVVDAIRRAELRKSLLSQAQLSRTQLSENTDSENRESDATNGARVNANPDVDLSLLNELSADLESVAQRTDGWGPLLADQSPAVAPAEPVVTKAIRASQPPRLDGKLDESIWDSTAAQTRNSNRMRLRVAYDDRFVYLAVETDESHFRDSEHRGPIGKRDDDLRAADRVRLGLDVDRDLLTAMRLEFTRKGRTHDHLDGADAWDPQWFVACGKDPDHTKVVAELAIERSSLGVVIQPGNRWFIECTLSPAGHPETLPWMPQSESWIAVQF